MDKKVAVTIIVVVVALLAIPLVSKVWFSHPSAPPATPDPSKAASPAPATEAASPAGVATEVVMALSKNDVAGVTAKLDDKMRALLTPGKIAESWNGMQAQFGAFKRQSVGQINKFEDEDEVHVLCEFERGKADVIVSVNRSLQVSNLQAVPAKP